MSLRGPTGRQRFRSWRKWGREKLILQIEVKDYEIDCVSGIISGRDVVFWRDATTADLTTTKRNLAHD